MKARLRWLITVLACTTVVVATALGALGAAPSETVRGSFERTLTVTGPVDLSVMTGAGDIVVRQGAGGSIHIRGKIQANGARSGADAETRVRELESHPPIEQNGNRIEIGRRENGESMRNVSIDYEIEAPADTRLTSRSGSGDLTVEGIRGPVEAQSGSGDLKLTSVSGSIQARTGSGDARLEGIKAEQVEVETGSGDVELHGADCALRVRTGSGEITAEGEPTGEWQLEASSGGIHVHLPSGKGFDVDAHTGSGDVSTSLPMTVQGEIGHGDWHGQVRGGGARILLRTGSGDIRID